MHDCTQCGEALRPADAFCSSCGATAPGQVPGDQAPTEVLPPLDLVAARDPRSPAGDRRGIPLFAVALLVLLGIGVVATVATLSDAQARQQRRAAAALPSPAASSEPASPLATPTSSEPDTSAPSTTSAAPTTSEPTPSERSPSRRPSTAAATTAPPPRDTGPADASGPPPSVADPTPLQALRDVLTRDAGAVALSDRAVEQAQAQCSGAGDYGRAVSALNEAVAARTQLLAALDSVGGGGAGTGQVKAALREALRAGLDADRAALRAVETAGARNCPSRQPAWQQGRERSRDAARFRRDAQRLWDDLAARTATGRRGG